MTKRNNDTKPVTYVNAAGQPVDTTPQPAKKKAPRTQPAAFHKGFRVMGLSPERQAQAKADHPRGAGPFDITTWTRVTKPKPVRSKPYESHEAALQCAEMARRAGWLQVEVRELTKGMAEPLFPEVPGHA